jgi:hypothetical protein
VVVRDIISIRKLIRTNNRPEEIAEIMNTFNKHAEK